MTYTDYFNKKAVLCLLPFLLPSSAVAQDEGWGDIFASQPHLSPVFHEEVFRFSAPAEAFGQSEDGPSFAEMMEEDLSVYVEGKKEKDGVEVGYMASERLGLYTGGYMTQGERSHSASVYSNTGARFHVSKHCNISTEFDMLQWQDVNYSGHGLDSRKIAVRCSFSLDVMNYLRR